MSSTGRVDPDNKATDVSVLRRIAANVTAWPAALIRAPRGHHVRAPAPLKLVGGIVLAVLAVAAAMALLDSWAISHQRLLVPWLVRGFDEITDFGKSGWFLYPLGTLIIAGAVVASPSLGRMTYLVLLSIMVRLGFVFTAVAAPGLVITVVKRLIGRARPMHFDASGPFAFTPFGWNVDFASLPSGHSTTAFSAAVAIGALYPRAHTAMWIFAIVIALSRVAIAAHYPSDVVAGAIVGSLGALLVRNWFAARRLGFTVEADGSAGALPGPSWRRIRRVLGKIVGM